MSDGLLGSSEVSESSVELSDVGDGVSSSAELSSSSSTSSGGPGPTGPAGGAKLSDEDLRNIPRR